MARTRSSPCLLAQCLLGPMQMSRAPSLQWQWTSKAIQLAQKNLAACFLGCTGSFHIMLCCAVAGPCPELGSPCPLANFHTSIRSSAPCHGHVPGTSWFVLCSDQCHSMPKHTYSQYCSHRKPCFMAPLLLLTPFVLLSWLSPQIAETLTSEFLVFILYTGL